MAKSCHHQHKVKKEAIYLWKCLSIRIVLGKLISHNPTIHMEILMFVSQKTKTKHRKIGNHRLDGGAPSVPGGRTSSVAL